MAELAEKNKSLESRLNSSGSSDGRRRDGSGGDDHDSADEKVQVEISRAANKEEARDLCTLKIAVRSSSTAPCNMTDVMVLTLKCLKDQIGDGVSLVAMGTSDDGGGTAGAGPTCVSSASLRTILTLKIKVYILFSSNPTSIYQYISFSHA